MSAASFIAQKGYRGRARELAQLTLTAHLPGSVEEVGVKGLAADGVLRLEEGVNHRVIDGYDLLPQHVATGLDIRFGCPVAMIAWGTDGVEISALEKSRRPVQESGGGSVSGRACQRRIQSPIFGS